MAVALVVVLAASRLNPVLTSVIDNRLDSTCDNTRYSAVSFDRSSWTPLRWKCRALGFVGID